MFCLNVKSGVDRLLLIQNGLAYLGQSAFFSLASVYFIEILHYSLAVVAFLLVYIAFLMRTARIIFAPLLDHIPFRIAFPSSLLLCTVGFLGLGYSKEIYQVMLFIFLISIGYGINNVLLKYAISELKDECTSLHRFARFAISVNLGTAIGPLIGNFFILAHARLGLTSFCGFIFFLAFVVSLFIVRETSFYTPKQQWIQAIRKYLYVISLKNYFLLSCLSWFLYAQLTSSFPLFMSQQINEKAFVGIIFLINALICIFSPIKMSKIIQRFSKDHRIILHISFLFYMCGFFMIAILPDLHTMLISVVFMSLGEVIMLPSLNAYLIEITDSNERIVGFTLSAVTMGIGESLGSFIGVYATKLGYEWHQPHLPFSFLSAVTVILIICSYIMVRNEQRGN